MVQKAPSDIADGSGQDANGTDAVIQTKTDRTQKVMNLMANTSIIMMSGMMGGLTQAMMETTEAMASGMAGAMGGEEAAEEVQQEIEQKTPEVEGQMQAMISEVRMDIYAQLGQKRTEIEPLLSDPAYDLGPRIVDGYDFQLPKLTEELDDSSLIKYSQMLEFEDPIFTEMFAELIGWMNSLPKFPEKSDS